MSKSATGSPDDGGQAQNPSDYDYADRVTVAFDFVEYPDKPFGDEAWVIELDGSAWRQEWLPTEIAKLLNSADSPMPCFVMESRTHHAQWGYSGTSTEVIVQVATTLATNAMWAGFTGLGSQLAERLRSLGHPGWQLTEEEANRFALATIATRFAEDSGAMSLLAAELRSDSSAEIVFSSPAGTRYTVELRRVGGVERLSRVRREN